MNRSVTARAVQMVAYVAPSASNSTHRARRTIPAEADVARTTCSRSARSAGDRASAIGEVNMPVATARRMLSTSQMASTSSPSLQVFGGCTSCARPPVARRRAPPEVSGSTFERASLSCLPCLRSRRLVAHGKQAVEVARGQRQLAVTDLLISDPADLAGPPCVRLPVPELHMQHPIGVRPGRFGELIESGHLVRRHLPIGGLEIVGELLPGPGADDDG